MNTETIMGGFSPTPGGGLVLGSVSICLVAVSFVVSLRFIANRTYWSFVKLHLRTKRQVSKAHLTLP